MRSFLLFISAILFLSMLAGCGPSSEDLEEVDYTSLPGDDWKVSTPAEQGLDPMLVAELYYNAAKLETLYGLLVIKNSHLIAERYFNEGSANRKNQLQSVTKSYTSALVGIALDQGCLSSVDQKMMDFFPEFTGRIADPRKEQITIRDMLQMRSGYPDEETDQAYFAALLSGDWVGDSLQRHTDPARSRYGYFRDLGYGYQWWSARAGDHHFNYAAGHGGQYIILLDELDMVIVTTSDPFWQQHDDDSWKHESAVIKLVGKFINSLPRE